MISGYSLFKLYILHFFHQTIQIRSLCSDQFKQHVFEKVMQFDNTATTADFRLQRLYLVQSHSEVQQHATATDDIRLSNSSECP